VVIFANGETISTRALIWAAGITASVFPGLPKNCYGRGKRLITDAFNKVAGTDNIFAIGDTSIQTTDKKFPNGHPQLAQVAIQQGKNLAYNLLAMAQGKELKPFAYFDKGTMAIIGRNKAVVDLSSNIHFKGLLAWLTWIFVHLLSLISYRNRITTLYNWMAAYFTEDQPLRMIIKPGEKDV
jgi:NADH dehydrogenase